MTSPEPHRRHVHTVGRRPARGSWRSPSCKSAGADHINDATNDLRTVLPAKCDRTSSPGPAPGGGPRPSQRVDLGFGRCAARARVVGSVRSGRLQPQLPLASVATIRLPPGGQVCAGAALVAIGAGPLAHVTRWRSHRGREPGTGGAGE